MRVVIINGFIVYLIDYIHMSAIKKKVRKQIDTRSVNSYYV